MSSRKNLGWQSAGKVGWKTRFARPSIYGSLYRRDPQIDDHPKSKEGDPTPFGKSPSMDRDGVERIAAGWGKVVARRVHDEVGPELDLDAHDIEQMAVTAARAVARGTIADYLVQKAALLGPSSPARRVGGPAPSGASHEPSTSGAARSPKPSQSATARPAAGIFFLGVCPSIAFREDRHADGPPGRVSDQPG
jgi:hypothetical protein